MPTSQIAVFQQINKFDKETFYCVPSNLYKIKPLENVYIMLIKLTFDEKTEDTELIISYHDTP